VRTLQGTKCASIRNTNLWTLCGDTRSAYCRNDMEHMNIFCGQNAEFLVLNLVIRISTT